MTLRRAAGNARPGIDHIQHGGAWLDGCDADAKVRLVETLGALPLAIEVETQQGPVGLIHADFPYDDWQAIHSPSFSEADEDACLWSVDRYRMKYARPVRNVRAVIHGHMTLRRPEQLGNVYYIDTSGGLDERGFTLLDLHTLLPAR